MKKPTEGAAKAQGMAKMAAAKLSGDHGILNTLAKEHGEVSALMMRVEATRDSGDGVSTRQEVFEKIAIELLSHANAEEREFYAVLERYPETQAKAKHANGEHGEIKRLITELDSIPYSSPEWMTRFSELKDTVEHHVHEEEGEMFELAKGVLSKDELKAMDKRFLAEKRTQRETLEGRSASPGAGAASPPPSP